MAHRSVRVGLIGCGGLPRAALLPALATIPELRLVITCDLREQAARDAAALYRADDWTTDWRAVLARDDLDGVMVVAPPAIHEEVGIAVLERGLHLYVEKPPSMTSVGARRLAEAARGRPLKTLLGTVQRHAPVHRLMKEISERPEFGRPLLYQARYCAPGPGMRMDWGMNRHSEEEMVRYFFLDHIIHHIDLARFFLGEIACVHAMRTTDVEDRQMVAVSLRFANSVAGSLTCGQRAPSFDNHVFLLGDGPAALEAWNWSRLAYRPPQAPVGAGGYRDAPQVTWDGGFNYNEGVIRPGYREELMLWARSILEDDPCHATVEDGLHDMLVVDAIQESLRTGATVAVEPE